jgi:lysophospholipase L1-like esterase
MPGTNPQPSSRFLPNYAGPTSGPQLYQQRLAALQAGRLYTRLPSHSFQTLWQTAQQQPTYEDWKQVLRSEARAVGRGQGNNRLSIMVGDSLSLWLPSEALPNGQLWLNQGISGDTTQGILNRLSAFANTRPDHIYIMGGINDLRRGATNNEILWNLRLIMRRLKQSHPQAQILVQSILPTSTDISNNRIRQINRRLARIADQEGVQYLDLYRHFADLGGNMRAEFTTDGLHLNAAGYGVWQSVLQEIQYWLAMEQVGTYVS